MEYITAIIAATMTRPEQFYPMPQQPTGKLRGPSGFTISSSKLSENARRQRGIPRDWKRWPETDGYPPISGGSDQENINKQLKQQLIKMIRDIHAWQRKKHPDVTIDDVMREFGHMSIEEIKQFKKEHPNAFNEKKREPPRATHG